MRATSLKKNVAANYTGQICQIVTNIAFVPLYVKFLGVEAYGLIGIYAMLQTWLTLADGGIKPALGREMARFTAGAHNGQSIRNLLRSVEVFGAAIAAGAALCIWGASGWLAHNWVSPKTLSVATVQGAFSAMGVIVAFRFFEDIYLSSLAGLQLQVIQNTVSGAVAIVRALGAVAVLAWISPTIEAFFLWQGLMSAISTTLLAASVYRALPAGHSRARFSWSSLSAVKSFAAGMLMITILSLLLTQVDKILLSRLLTLEAFGYYALAGVVANGLNSLTNPIMGAFYPRFTQLAAVGDAQVLGSVYHQGTQLISVLTGSATVVLVVLGNQVLRVWTGDEIIAVNVAPIMAVLALGTLFNTLMWAPYHLQLAHGWTSLTIKSNAVAVCLLVPAIMWTVPRYGAIGAARLWVSLNAAYLLLIVPLVHRRLLQAEKWRWYREDVLIPLSAAAVTALACRWAIPEQPGRLSEMLVLAIVSALALSSAAFAAPAVRDQILIRLPRLFRRSGACAF
jgi:O-antigen/teichoic acid export membrane protein